MKDELQDLLHQNGNFSQTRKKSDDALQTLIHGLAALLGEKANYSDIEEAKDTSSIKSAWTNLKNEIDQKVAQRELSRDQKLKDFNLRDDHLRKAQNCQFLTSICIFLKRVNHAPCAVRTSIRCPGQAER